MTQSLYAGNPSAYNFQPVPSLRLMDFGGKYFEDKPYQNSNVQKFNHDAVDSWLLMDFPLNTDQAVVNCWAVTPSGKPDISGIRYLVIHIDTWDNGFTL